MAPANSELQKHVTAVQLVDALGITERAVRKRATREAWPSRARAGRGGGVEYCVAKLPEDVRIALAKNAASDAAEAGRAVAARIDLTAKLDARADDARREEALVELPTLDAAAQARMAARLDVLARMAAFQRTLGVSERKAAEAFALAYTRGDVDVPAEVKAQIGESVSWRTLARWQETLRRTGPAALGGSYGKRGRRVYLSTVEADPHVHDFVVAMVAETPHATARHVEMGLEARFPEAALPKLRAIERFLARWKADHASLFLKLSNPDAWRSKHMAAFGSASEGVVRLNQRWELDSTPADVLLADGKRHTILGCIDVFTRRLVLYVSRTSKGTAVGATLRRALLAWGVPEEVKTDNGADYASKYVTAVIHGLGIQQRLCTPFSPWEKPHIERALGTFSHGLLEMAAGYVGHDVAERSAIRSRQSFADRLMKRGEVVEVRMTADELQQFCDTWCARIYEHETHGALGMSPFKAAAAWREPVRRITNERALDVLLQTAPGDGTRVVQKKGLVVDGAVYLHEELGAYVGERVAVRYDEADLGRVFVFTVDGEFVCCAENPERTGISLADVAARAKTRQRQIMAEGLREIKTLQREVKPGTVVEEILESRAYADGLRILPPPAEAHETPALVAAAEAADARTAQIERPALRPVAITDAQRAQAAAWEAEQQEARNLAARMEAEAMERARALMAEDANRPRIYHTDFDRYADLRDRRLGGERMNDADVAFLAAFEAEYVTATGTS